MTKKNSPKAGAIAKTQAGTSFNMAGDAFDTAAGELIAGGNILKLAPGEAAGWFVLKEIKVGGFVPKPKADKKGVVTQGEPIDVYIAKHGDREIRMPIAAGFLGKAKDASLKVGDTFGVKRTADYANAHGGTGKGYEIKITARADR